MIFVSAAILVLQIPRTDQGPVTLSSRVADGMVRLEVASSGTSAALLTAGDPWLVGTERGLGLAVVRWIAEQHGGRLGHEFEAGRNWFSVDVPRGQLA